MSNEARDGIRGKTPEFIRFILFHPVLRVWTGSKGDPTDSAPTYTKEEADRLIASKEFADCETKEVIPDLPDNRVSRKAVEERMIPWE